MTKELRRIQLENRIEKFSERITVGSNARIVAKLNRQLKNLSEN